jgi:hypothetical protein
MSVTRWLRGYNRQTEVLGGQWGIPSDEMPWIRRTVGKPDDPELLDPHPLSARQVRSLAARLCLPIDPTEYDYYIEAEDDWKKVAEMRDARQPI